MKSTAIILGLGPLALAQSIVSEVPSPQGTTTSSSAIEVDDSFDCGMYLYDRDPAVCEEQEETGQADAMFILSDGASISNCIIGPNQAEGIHCLGSCTIENVYFQDVCEDAITAEGDGTMTITGGGAWAAEDKIIQLNGEVDLVLSYFYAEDYGKVVRSCGNCDEQYERHVTISNSVAVDGGVFCGINSNYGDTCTINDSCQDDGESCAVYEGNDDGDEPEEISSGPDGTYCIVSNLSEDC